MNLSLNLYCYKSNEKINTLIAERLEAKKMKDFERADQIRQDLLDMDIEIKDSQEGTEWSVKQ